MDYPHQKIVDRRVLWIGPIDGNEFGACYSQLAKTSSVTIQEELSVAVATLKDSESFDLVVIACPRPLVTTAPLEALRDAIAPTPLVQLLGTWCEGEGRTGKTIEGVERVFWHAWANDHTLTPTQHLEDGPIQDGPVEGGLIHGGLAEIGLVEIKSRDAEFAKSLVETLAPTTPAVWSPASACIVSTPPAAVLWDGSQLSGHEANELYEICQKASKAPMPVIAMLDFPRPETITAAQDIGATAILGKPFSVEQLLETLTASLQASRSAEQILVETIEVDPVGETQSEPTSLREQLLAEREQLAREAA